MGSEEFGEMLELLDCAIIWAEVEVAELMGLVCSAEAPRDA
ncbi:hypothetical protein [Pseudomonas syringae]|nr:hypothetical protein [Pseudomonas syringae]